MIKKLSLGITVVLGVSTVFALKSNAQNMLEQQARQACAGYSNNYMAFENCVTNYILNQAGIPIIQPGSSYPSSGSYGDSTPSRDYVQEMRDECNAKPNHGWVEGLGCKDFSRYAPDVY